VYLIMARTGGPGPKGISAFLVEKVGCASFLLCYIVTLRHSGLGLVQL